MSDVPPVSDPVEPAPVVDPPVAPEAPTYDWADATTQEQAATALAHMQEWGSPDEVKQALEVYKNFQSDEGLSRVFVETGRRFGIPFEKIEALFSTDPPAPAADPEPEPDPNEPMTRAEAMALMESQLEERLAAAQQQTTQQNKVAAAQAATGAELAALGITDPDEVQQVLTRGQKHIAADDYDPEHIREAVRKGHADFTAFVQAKAEAYLAKKRETEKNLPTPIGGASPGGDAVPEPQTVAEARQRVRARFRDAG